MAVLDLISLGKTFEQGGKTLKILDDLSLTLGAGETVALVGASGSGKSTLLQIAGLLDYPTSGTVMIDGEDTASMKDNARTAIRRNKLGFVYQFHHLLPDFSALENVTMAAQVQGMADKAAAAAAADLLVDLGLSERFDHVPSRLSGGEQQRVAIARALVGGPSLILADEPTGNLDIDTSERVFERMTDVVKTRGASALIVTHDRALAQRADRALKLTRGRIEPLTPEEGRL